MLSYNYTVLILGTTSFIYAGTKLQVRWMRYDHDFPARSFLQNYPDDFARFLLRVEEMGNTGRISLPSQGHALSGKAHRGLYEFKMNKTRAYGFEHSGRFIVVSAATKKKKKSQIMDHDFAAKLRRNYLDHIDDQND